MILDIPPTTAHIIQHIATRQGVSVEQFFINSAYEKALELAYMPNQETRQATKNDDMPKDGLVLDFLNALPNRSYLGDELALQKAMRDDMLDQDYAGEPSQSPKLGTRIAQRFEAIADDDFSIPSRMN